MSRIASIDIGTNTVRLLIARENPDGIEPLLVQRVVTRLGGGFTPATGISPEAWERTGAALASFAEELRRQPVSRLRAVATSAVREAVNGPAFCRDILERTGIELEVIGGDEEALLTLRGVLHGIGTREGNFLVFDIGGGSTEYVVAADGVPLFARSLLLGVVRLTETTGGDLASIRRTTADALRELHSGIRAKGALPDPAASVLVATAGTATTLAAIDLGMADYDYRKVNGHVMSRKTIEGIFSRLLPLTPRDRLAIPGLEAGREDLIIAGTAIVLETMEIFGYSSMKVSDAGLLEGVAVTLARTN